VHGHLSRVKDDVDGPAILVRLLDGLRQDVLLFGSAAAIFNLTVPVRAGDKLHAGVFRIRVVDRQPERGGFRRGARPVTGVLMPSEFARYRRAGRKYTVHQLAPYGQQFEPKSRGFQGLDWRRQ